MLYLWSNKKVWICSVYTVSCTHSCGTQEHRGQTALAFFLETLSFTQLPHPTQLISAISGHSLPPSCSTCGLQAAAILQAPGYWSVVGNYRNYVQTGFRHLCSNILFCHISIQTEGLNFFV